MFHLDPSNRLATVHQRYRQTEETGQTDKGPIAQGEPFHVCYMLSPVRRLSLVCLSVTLVHPSQAVVNFGNFSMAFRILAIR